ncbi:MAG: hypothetical protein ACRDA4_08215 [Filifactoraceae bacterium]
MKKSRLLMKEQPLVVDKELAKIIGLNEAIVLQQIEYWININAKSKNSDYTFKAGFQWTYNSISDWQEEFPFWSYDTVKRTLKKLRDKGILITGNYNELPADRTIWYRIDYAALDNIEYNFYNSAKCPNEKTSQLEEEKVCETALNNNSANCPNAIVQNAPMQKCKMPQAIPEITTKIKTKTPFTTQSSACSELIESQTHIRLTKNMMDIVDKWDIDRCTKAIAIFKKEGGNYFSLLKKIYCDDGNYSVNKKSNTKFNNFDPVTTDFKAIEELALSQIKESDESIENLLAQMRNKKAL